MRQAIDLAKYIVNKCTCDEKPISNLHLQKILYYIQKNFLINDNIAFYDEIEAWQFGPVVPNVYYYFCGFGAMPISSSYDVSMNDYTCEEISLINDIVETKRILDPWDLVEETHHEGGAWNTIYQNGSGNHSPIPIELIRERG